MSSQPATTNGVAHDDGMPAATYGFIGIGNMGWGMAKNLRSKMPPSSKLVVCELNTARRDEFISSIAKTQAEGSLLLEVADSPKEIAEKSDIIITMLPSGRDVREVFTDPSNGILSIEKEKDENRRRRQRFFLECSTIEVSTSLEIGNLVAQSGMGDFIDVPVSGGPQAADAATLTFMLGGGGRELFAKAKPILSSMGKEENIFFCGPPGAGLATKQLNNYVANISFIGLCEAMNTGILYGLDPKVLAGVLNSSSGMCWNSLYQNPVKGVNPAASSARDFEGGFPTELCKGIIDMAVDLSEAVGAKSVMGPVMKDIFARAVKNEKCRGKECRSVYRLFAEDEGRDLE